MLSWSDESTPSEMEVTPIIDITQKLVLRKGFASTID
jgi:hypothetical protein